MLKYKTNQARSLGWEDSPLAPLPNFLNIEHAFFDAML